MSARLRVSTSAAGAQRGGSLGRSLGCAIEGLAHVVRTQRNMRLHLVAAGAVVAAALLTGVSGLGLVALVFAIGFVLVAEMVNSAIEQAVDLATTSVDRSAKLAKDMAAGAVLVAAVTAVVVGLVVFADAVGGSALLVLPLAPTARRLSSQAAAALLRQFARFVLVGLSNTALSFVVYAALVSGGTPYWAAGALAFGAGAVNGYILNRRWTFASPDSTATRARYLAVQLAGLGATEALLWLFVSLADVGRIGGYLVTVPLVTVATFLANRTWTFAPAAAAPATRELLAELPIPARPGTGPAVDIVIPVYNEVHDLEPSIRRLHAYLSRSFPFSFRITIADNASTDGTWELARRLTILLPDLRAIHLDEKGRGRALRAAWSRSDADVLAYMDVDLSTGLDALLPLVAPLLSGHSDLAIGSRLGHSAHVARGAKRELVSRSYNLILRLVLRAHFSDAQCGFKAIRADRARLLLPLVEDTGWFFDTELLVLAERAALRIHEVPVDWTDDPDSRVEILPTAIADLRGIARLLRSLALRRLPLPALRAELESRGRPELLQRPPALALVTPNDLQERGSHGHRAA